MVIIINELLCLVQYFGYFEFFFTEEENVKAQNAIYKVCKKSCTGALPCNIVRKRENKKKQDVADLMNYVTSMDEANHKNDLPTFVAHNQHCEKLVVAFTKRHSDVERYRDTMAGDLLLAGFHCCYQHCHPYCCFHGIHRRSGDQ